MHAGGAMRFLAVDSNGFPIDPKESTDVVMSILIHMCMTNTFIIALP